MRSPTAILLSITGLLIVLTTGLMLLMRVIFAGLGGQIAFESNRSGNWDIYLLDLRTGISQNLTHSRTDEFSPAWSPDGRQIVFNSDHDGDGRSELYIMGADGSHLHQVSKGNGDYRNAHWSPDGRELVFTINFGQIHIMNTDGSQERWLSDGFTPSLSPDGNRVLYYAYTQSEVDEDVFAFDLISKQIIDLTANPAIDWGAIWSPDGQQIAFASSRDGRSAIYIMKADGSDPHALTDQSANAVNPAWSPDGQQIAFTSDKPGSPQIYIINVDGSGQHAVTASPGDSQEPAWRPPA